MKRLLITLSLLFTITFSFAQNYGANRNLRWANEYMSFGIGWYMNPSGPVQNFIVIYNTSQETFDTRIVIKEIGVDITTTVTPEGNSMYPGETMIWIGHIPELNIENGQNPMMQIKIYARSENIQFHLSDTLFRKSR